MGKEREMRDSDKKRNRNGLSIMDNREGNKKKDLKVDRKNKSKGREKKRIKARIVRRRVRVNLIIFIGATKHIKL